MIGQVLIGLFLLTLMLGPVLGWLASKRGRTTLARHLRNVSGGLWVAVVLAGGASRIQPVQDKVVIPLCTSLACQMCADWLDLEICIAATTGM